MGYATIPNPYPMDQYHEPFRPAPIMTVWIRHIDIMDKIALIRAFLDSGADRTMLAPWGPEEIERQIDCGISPVSIHIGGRPMPAYELDVSFDGEHWYHPDRLVLYRQYMTDYRHKEDMLIGRDILWQLEFCCNGPDEVFSLKDPEHC